MNAVPHEVLAAARTHAGLSFDDLWIGYFALGGEVDPETVRSYLGGTNLSRMDYDVLAAVINEHFVDHGDDHPVPYYEELV